jgi:hypothetical protein
MTNEWRAALVAALRSGEYVQGGRGFMSEGEDPGTHEPAGVLCLLFAKAGIIPPPTRQRVGKDITWLYRGHDGEMPSCMSIPEKVLIAAGMSVSLGDPLVINGSYHSWAIHAANKVSFADFANALEMSPSVTLPAPTEVMVK